MILYTEAQVRDLLSSMQGVTPRLVIVSSADVYRAYGRLHRTEPGPADPVPLGEDAPLRERLYPYRAEPPRRKDDADRWRDDYDKIPIERLVMNSPEMTGTVIRLPMVYGPRDPQHRFFDPAKRMSDLREYILLEERHARWCCSWGYVENVADAIAIAATNQRAAGRIYNVCETSCLSWARLVEAIAEAVGWSGRIVMVPTEKAPEQLKLMSKVLDLDQDLLLDSTRIRSELGYAERVGFPEALRRTVEWEAANPPDPVNAAVFDYAAEDAIVEGLVL